MKNDLFYLNVEDTHKHKYEIDTGNFRFPNKTRSFNRLVARCNTSCLRASNDRHLCYLKMLVGNDCFFSLYKPG